jgi:hypothetical protein
MIFADVGVGQFVACSVVISIDVFDGRFGCCVVADFQSMFSIVGLDVAGLVKLTLSWLLSHKWSPCIVWFPDGRRRS